MYVLARRAQRREYGIPGRRAIDQNMCVMATLSGNLTDGLENDAMPIKRCVGVHFGKPHINGCTHGPHQFAIVSDDPSLFCLSHHRLLRTSFVQRRKHAAPGKQNAAQEQRDAQGRAAAGIA